MSADEKRVKCRVRDLRPGMIFYTNGVKCFVTSIMNGRVWYHYKNGRGGDKGVPSIGQNSNQFVWVVSE